MKDQRAEILARAGLRVSARNAPAVSPLEIGEGLPIFLDQLCASLLLADRSEVSDHTDLDRTARDHGHQLFDRGVTAAQVVHDYGDLCQVITGLAVEQKLRIQAKEFQTLNLCLDDAIAGAITAYAEHREQRLADDGVERLGIMAHELRNVVNTALLAFGSIKKGLVAPGGSTGQLLERNLLAIEALVNRSLADVRLATGVRHAERIPVWELVEEAAVAASLAAEARGIVLAVGSISHSHTVVADRQILAAALANLLQNAIKFTEPSTRVQLRTLTTTTRVLIEVEDRCGGLPEGKTDELLVPFSQRDANRSGLGLGLAICVNAMQTMKGELHIRDLPGTGCIFTLDLPLALERPLLDGEQDHEVQSSHDT